MRILALDGGVAAALNVRLLRLVEERAPGFLAGVDLIAGTSDGALLGLFLASRLGRDHTANLAAIDGAIAFFDDVITELRVRPGLVLDYAIGRGPRSLASALRRVFERHLGTETLGGLADGGKRVLVLAIDRQTWKRRTFTSLDVSDDADRRRTLVDLALSCSAFPVVLPAHESEADGRSYLDAALITNNPSLVAVREAIARGVSLDTITLLSLGATESSAERLDRAPARGIAAWLPKTLDRLGFMGWTQLLARAVYLPDFMLQGSVDILDLQCADLLGDRYRRVRPVLPEIDYLAGAAIPGGWLRRRLDDDAQHRFDPEGPDVRWVRETWMSAR